MLRTGKIDGKWLVKILTSFCGRKALIEILLKSNTRSRLEAVPFINGAAESIPKTVRHREIVSYLPDILAINVKLFGSKTANYRSIKRKRRAVHVKGEIRRVLRKPAQQSGKSMSGGRPEVRREGDARNTGQVRQPGINRGRYYGTRTLIERLIRDAVVKRVRKVLTVVADEANVRAETKAVVALDPREIVSDVLCRSGSPESPGKQIR